MPFRMTLSDLTKYLMTLSVARPPCDSWTSCRFLLLLCFTVDKKALDAAADDDESDNDDDVMCSSWLTPTVSSCWRRCGSKVCQDSVVDTSPVSWCSLSPYVCRSRCCRSSTSRCLALAPSLTSCDDRSSSSSATPRPTWALSVRSLLTFLRLSKPVA